jgi:hypothetical protein
LTYGVDDPLERSFAISGQPPHPQCLLDVEVLEHYRPVRVRAWMISRRDFPERGRWPE